MSPNKILGYLSAAPRVSTLPDAETSGPRAHVLGVIHAFQSLGWQVEAFIVGDQVPRNWVGSGSENLVSGNPFRSLAADLLRLTMGVVNSWRAWRFMRGKVDWVYERFATLQSLGSIFKRHKIPWILETNALYFEEAARERKSLILTGIAKRLEIAAYHRCDVLICVSQPLKEMIIQRTGTPGEKILVVPNGVDINFFDPNKHSPRRIFTGFTIGYVGSLYAWQGLDLLFHAVSELRKDEGIEIFIVIVGDGLMRTEWEKLSSDLGITTHVKFIGNVPWKEVPEYIAGFDIGFSSKVLSKTDSDYFSPLKLYEYMSMGKPVLSSSLKDGNDIVKQYKTGFVFPASDKIGLKNSLMEVYYSQGKLMDLGYNARQEAVEHFSWQHRVSNMIDGIETILDEIGRSYL